MSREQEAVPPAEQRLDQYLRRQKREGNVFVDEESDIDEFLLKRAEAELRRAQARVDLLREEFADKMRRQHES